MIEFLYCMLPCVVACTLIFVAPLALIVFISSDISSLPGESKMTEKTEQKIEQFWRDATAEDVARVMKGEKVEARFRDDDAEHWSVSRFLGGYNATCPNSLHWISSNANQWKFCQVYDPPQWYLDKPDPGEGWRLLEKFPDEDLREGDEIWVDESWCLSWRANNDEKIQKTNKWYRRRIEPVKQDAGSTCASTIPKGWTALLLDEPRLASDAYWSLGAKCWVIIDECRLELANRDKWPAIRQVENWRCMMLMEGCCYRLPNGHGIKVTKEGFELE